MIAEATITKQDGLAYRNRWELVRPFENEELRRTPIEVKFRQFPALTQSAATLDADPARKRREEETRRAEEDQARQRRARLRELWRERHV